VPTLQSGDRLTQAEFHRIYEQMPENFKAELIGGTVYVASPLGWDHGNYHIDLGTIVNCYRHSTPGVEAADNATVILGDLGEPQPDISLRIRPEYGGRSTTTLSTTTGKRFVKGALEWIGEVSHSSRAIDLGGKRSDYRTYGVLEYVVVCVDEQALRWFNLREDRELKVSADHILRSFAFPGLWIDIEALMCQDGQRFLATLQQGLATPEHAAFVESLKKRHAELEAESKTVRMNPKPRAGKKPTRKRKKP
jgi:Uma2 family endonuclease